MLDPCKRKCSICFEEQEKWKIPIPSCSDPDGDGVACPYPTISKTLDRANVEAWVMWSTYPDQLIKVDVTMGGPIFTLNLDSLRYLMDLTEVRDKIEMFNKVRVLFNIWKEKQEADEGSKTKKSMARTKSLKGKKG